MFVILAVLTSISALTMVLAGGLSILRNARREEHRWFFLMALCLAIWIIVNFLGSNVVRPVVTETFVKLDFSFALLGSWLFLQFVAALMYHHPFYGGKKAFLARNKYFRPASLVVVFLMCVAIALGQVFHAQLNDHGLDVIMRPGFGIYVVCVAFLAFYAIDILMRGWYRIAKKNRSGLDVILVGGTIFVLTNMASNLLFPNIISSRSVVQQLNIIGHIGVVTFVICIYLAMTVNKLFDIRLGVLRSAVYILSTTLLAVIYIAPVLYVLEEFVFRLHFTLLDFVLTVLLTTIIANSYISIRKRFDSLTKKMFFRDSYDSALLLGELNKLLVSSVEINEMLKKSSKHIADNMKIEFCGFVLKATLTAPMRVAGVGDLQHKITPVALRSLVSNVSHFPDNVIEADYLATDANALRISMSKNDIAVAVRLTTDAKKGAAELGFMLLGYKKNGDPYNTQDLVTLETVGDAMVIAIQNALHFEEIQDFNLTLQRKVDEATAKLRRTNAKLKALDETKDDFISMASHQLRTPLTSVKGYLSMVLDGDAGKLTPLQHKMLDQAFVSSQRMVFLIADLLNVSRLKTGKFVIEPSPVDLSKTVDEEIKQLVETAKNRSLELVYDKPAAFPTLMLDETKIRQVIMNFVDNAIYYTPAGGTIRVELADKPESVELRIVDNGIGVPKSEAPHLFTKFYRAGNARQARPDGTGLGLFMAKKVIVAQGGAIIFESREGKGSIFGFVLPKAALLPSAQAGAPEPAKSPALQR